MVVISPRQRFSWADVREFWEYRDLLFALARRDVAVRYKQTFIGVAWAVLQPLVTMTVYSVSFGMFAKVPSDGLPYPIFAFTGLIFWTLFSSALSSAADSLVSNQAIVKKVYFPRLITPITATAVSVIDFTCSLLVLFGLMAYYHIKPSLVGLALIPLLALWSILASLGIGWFLAALNVKYRDVRHALPFFIQLLVFVSPVIYPARIFRNHAWILALNPMTGVIETARFALLGAGSVTLPVIATSIGMSVVLVVIGFLYFRDTEKALADVL